MSHSPWRIRDHAARLAGVVLLLCCAAQACATNIDAWTPFGTPWFDKVDAVDGLPHSITTAVAQDRGGLVWIGTMGGLVRYDGYRMQVFEASGNDAAGLPDTYVRALIALPDGGMLVGTNAGGITRFDPATNGFHAYPADGSGDRRIYGFAADGRSGVWIATNRGLDRLDLRTDTVAHVATGTGISPRNFSVLQDRAGNLWLGNNDGLFVRYAGDAEFVRPAHPGGIVATVLANQIWAIREDGRGRIWVGSGQAGAAYLDRDAHWQAVAGFSGYSGGAFQATVRDFLEAAPDEMWIGTDGNGVIAYRAGDDHVRRIDHDAATPSSLPGNSVRAMLKDGSGNVWVATDLGVARTDQNALAAFALLPSPLKPNALADSNVHGIFVDTHQRIWLGLSDGRIDLIDLKKGGLQHLRLQETQSQRDVQAFAETPDGTIWAGSRGLSRIDPKTLNIQSSVLPALANVPVLSLLPEGSDLLIGTYDGAYRLDPRKDALEHFSHQPGVEGSLASDTVRTMARVDHAIWYGTTHGISIADTAGKRDGFHTLAHHDGDEDSLPQDFIGAIVPDARGRVWVSTFGGLAVLEQHDAGTPFRFKTIGVRQGLASDKINAVLPDDDGNLWVSMSSGIAMIDGDTHAVHNLSARDGLRIPSYVDTASARAPDGSLLFGGLGGLTVIHPGLRSQANGASLAITQATVGDAAVVFARLPHNGEAIRLDQPGPRGRSLRVEFSLLDYRQPMETRYSYRMQGFEDNWTDIPHGGMPTAVYTNLPHGNYTLQLRATTFGIHARTYEVHFCIEVTPRWYETVIARIAALLLLLLVIAGLVHLRTIYLRRQAQELQRQIDEHTLELRAANQRLDELAGTDELTGVYNRRRFLELARGERELARSHEEHPACMAVLDLDRFKEVNDTYGHLAGDAVIRGVIGVIRRQCRPTDIIGRYGGEEFVLCLPDTSLTQAMKIGERIRSALSEATVSYQGQSIAVTTSIGIAELEDGESIEQWLSRADRALYLAKRSGRDRCIAAS